MLFLVEFWEYGEVGQMISAIWKMPHPQEPLNSGDASEMAATSKPG